MAAGPVLGTVLVVFLALTFAAWRRYLAVAKAARREPVDDCPYGLTEVFGEQHLANVPHQRGVQWLTEIFTRSARRYPNHTALQIAHTGESLTYAELDARADAVAAALDPYLTGPDQTVAVAMAQDDWRIVASHLGILKAGGTVLFLDTTLPDAVVSHVLGDAQPVVVLTRGQQAKFRDLATLDVLTLPDAPPRSVPPSWLDDPKQRLAAIFYTSGTTGMPKGVECPHAGYVNLALSYAEYFNLVPGMDATSLTSSLGYDGCISEMYSAWVAGCSVVLLTKEEVRSGPDLLPVLRDAEVTVLFCPPVLLTTLTSEPEWDLPHPLCRYVVPAGEAFPPALVEPWTRGRRQIINTYGPTEASTDTSRQNLRPGEPVTIGSPLANVSYVILEPGRLEPLHHGEVGELCIGGVHVARGYRNLPEQTAERFIAHPRFGRLYRTGDKGRIDPQTHRVHFLGRIDAQIKVRGHRVETQPVEDLLQSRFAELEAAVLDYQNEELVAFVVAPSLAEAGGASVATAPAAWAARAKATLAERLPEPSVPTRFFLVDAFVMKPLSGKIDRERLPRVSDLFTPGEPRPSTAADPGAGAEGASSRQPTEQDEDDVLTICREVFESPIGWDDAFADHGGHSIVIARLSQRLREADRVVPVRALLTDCNTARKIAALPRESSPNASGSADLSPTPRGLADAGPPARADHRATPLSVAHFTVLQVLFLSLLYAPAIVGLVALVAVGEVGELIRSGSLGAFVRVGLVAYLAGLAFSFVSLLWVLAIKRILGRDRDGRHVAPGVYPKWSRPHFRVWCLEQVQNSVLRPLRLLFRSAPLMAWVLRKLGATVGENLQYTHGVSFSGPLDLLFVEDDVAIQTGAYVATARWVGQDLHVGPIHLESGCKIGMRAAVAHCVAVGRGSWITPFTPIFNDVGPEEIWEGSPARRVGRCTELARTTTLAGPARATALAEGGHLAIQAILECLLLIVPTAAVAWLTSIALPGGAEGLGASVLPLWTVAWQIALYGFVTTWATIVVISVLACLFLRFTPTSPGLVPVRSLRAALLLYRTKKMDEVQRLWTWTVVGQYLRALAGVRFTRLGASECDVMMNLVPETTTAHAQVFWSHGCFTNMLDHGSKHLLLRRLDMPANFFSANNSVAESGHFPTNFLLGVSTPGDDIRFRRQMRTRLGPPITVAGNPPVRFGSADFETEKEGQPLPSFPLFLARVTLGDVLGIGALPIADVIVYAVVYTFFVRWLDQPLLSACAALVATEAALAAAAVGVKAALVGRTWGRSHSAPFWSVRHFTYFFAQDCFFAWCRSSLGLVSGTLLPNALLRRMGCHIGKRTLIASPLQLFDWNAVSFGDDCVVDGFLQYHTFENMTLKVKRTEIEDRGSVSFGATVMGGARLEPDTTLLPLSMVLKGMHLPSGAYEGSPVDQVRPPLLLSEGRDESSSVVLADPRTATTVPAKPGPRVR